MRVITGTARSRTLKTLTGKDTRPTSAQIKESMFSAIQFKVEGAVVLDLFAGSGQLGIEALSRGAETVFFTDNNMKAVTIIKENLKHTQLSEKAKVYRKPHKAFLRLVRDEFDIAFLDPPYSKGLIEKTFPILIPKMKPNSVIVCEHEKELTLPDLVEGFKIYKIYNYGSISLTIYRNGNTI